MKDFCLVEWNVNLSPTANSCTIAQINAICVVQMRTCVCVWGGGGRVLGHLYTPFGFEKHTPPQCLENLPNFFQEEKNVVSASIVLVDISAFLIRF